MIPLLRNEEYALRGSFVMQVEVSKVFSRGAFRNNALHNVEEFSSWQEAVFWARQVNKDDFCMFHVIAVKNITTGKKARASTFWLF